MSFWLIQRITLRAAAVEIATKLMFTYIHRRVLKNQQDGCCRNASLGGKVGVFMRCLRPQNLDWCRLQVVRPSFLLLTIQITSFLRSLFTECTVTSPVVVSIYCTLSHNVRPSSKYYGEDTLFIYTYIC